MNEPTSSFRDGNVTPYGLVDWTKRLVSISDCCQWTIIWSLSNKSKVVADWVAATNKLLTAMGVIFDSNKLLFDVGLKTNEDLLNNLLASETVSEDEVIMNVEPTNPVAQTFVDPLPWWHVEFRVDLSDEFSSYFRIVSLKVEAETWYTAREMARIHLKMEIPQSAKWKMLGTPPTKLEAGEMVYHYLVLKQTKDGPMVFDIYTGALV